MGSQQRLHATSRSPSNIASPGCSFKEKVQCAALLHYSFTNTGCLETMSWLIEISLNAAHYFIQQNWKANRSWVALEHKLLCFGSLDYNTGGCKSPAHLPPGSCLMIWYWCNDVCFILDNERKCNLHLKALFEIPLDRAESKRMPKVKATFSLVKMIFLGAKECREKVYALRKPLQVQYLCVASKKPKLITLIPFAIKRTVQIAKQKFTLFVQLPDLATFKGKGFCQLTLAGCPSLINTF